MTQVPLGRESWSESLGYALDGLAPQFLHKQYSTGPIAICDVKSLQGTIHADGSAAFSVTQKNGHAQPFEQTRRGVFQDFGHSLSVLFEEGC